MEHTVGPRKIGGFMGYLLGSVDDWLVWITAGMSSGFIQLLS